MTPACVVKILADIYAAINTGMAITKRFEHNSSPNYIAYKVRQRPLLPRPPFIQTAGDGGQIC